MNLFLIANLSMFITGLLLTILLLIYGRNTLHRTWMFLNIFVFIWGIGATLISIASNSSVAWLGWKIAGTGGLFLPPLFYQIIYIFAGLNKKKILFLVYLQAFIFLLLIWLTREEVMFGTSQLLFNSFFYHKANFNFAIMSFCWAFTASLGLYELMKYLKKSSGIRRIQARYLLVAFFIGFVGGGSVLLPTFGTPLYPLGNFGITLYVIIGTYAILRRQLMDIEVVIKKSLVFAGMFAFVFGVVVAVAMTVAHLLGGANNLLSLAVSALIITFTMRPIEAFLINSTDKFLFQKKHEYKEILKAFIDEVITVMNLDEIINSTLELLERTIHPYTSAIFILNRVEDKYQLYNADGLEKKDIVLPQIPNLSSSSRNPASRQ